MLISGEKLQSLFLVEDILHVLFDMELFDSGILWQDFSYFLFFSFHGIIKPYQNRLVIQLILNHSFFPDIFSEPF